MALRMLSRLLGNGVSPRDPAIRRAERREDLLVRSVHWRPLLTGRSAHADRGGRYALFVSQRVLRVTRAHLEKAGRHELYGFLYGRVVEDDAGGFVVVDRAVAASEPMPRRDQPLRFLDSVERAREAESEAERIVGWYHNHRFLGLQLTEQDVEIHLAHFREPWQCALVLIPTGDSPRGAFFQRPDGERYFRRALVPFHELAHGDAEPASDGRPFSTCVDWKNYVTSADVTLAGSGPAPRVDRVGSPRVGGPHVDRVSVPRVDDGDAPGEPPAPPEPERRAPADETGEGRPRRTTRPLRPAAAPRETTSAAAQQRAGESGRLAQETRTVTESAQPARRGELADSARHAPVEPPTRRPEIPLLLPPNSHPTLWERLRRLVGFR